MIPLQTLPTRITDTSATCIDHIYLRLSKRILSKSARCGAFYVEISDHLPIFICISHIKHSENERRSVRIFSESNISKFKTDLAAHDWQNILDHQDTNLAYSSFVSTYNSILN